MKRSLHLLLSLVLLAQPALVFARTLTGTERVSRRTLVNTHREGRRAQAAGRVTGSTAPKATIDTPYNKVGEYTPALPAQGYTLGNADAPVTVVEFIDYACPFCTQFALKTLPTIQKRYITPGNVRFVFRNYPLSFHAAATVAAQAVECSREQSEGYALQLQKKFFAATKDGTELTADHVYDAFQSLKGIDTEQMYYCIDTGATIPQIQDDMKAAADGGVGGVPSFWVLGPNGKTALIQGAQDFASFKKVFDTILK